MQITGVKYNAWQINQMRERLRLHPTEAEETLRTLKDAVDPKNSAAQKAYGKLLQTIAETCDHAGASQKTEKLISQVSLADTIQRLFDEARQSTETKDFGKATKALEEIKSHFPSINGDRKFRKEVEHTLETTAKRLQYKIKAFQERQEQEENQGYLYDPAQDSTSS